MLWISAGSPGRDEMLFSKPNCKVDNLLCDPAVVCLADKCEKSPAQILLRHSIQVIVPHNIEICCMRSCLCSIILQKRIAVIPKTSSKERLQENLDIFNFYLIPRLTITFT